MIEDRLTELAVSLLRVALGLMFIAHSVVLALPGPSSGRSACHGPRR
jgi:hypothetical protein